MWRSSMLSYVVLFCYYARENAEGSFSNSSPSQSVINVQMVLPLLYDMLDDIHGFPQGLISASEPELDLIDIQTLWVHLGL